jgi:natural product precursor
VEPRLLKIGIKSKQNLKPKTMKKSSEKTTKLKLSKVAVSKLNPQQLVNVKGGSSYTIFGTMGCAGSNNSCDICYEN